MISLSEELRIKPSATPRLTPPIIWALPVPENQLAWHTGLYESSPSRPKTPFGGTVLDCLKETTASALENHRAAIGSNEFGHTNAGYLHAFLSLYFPLAEKALTNPESTRFQNPETYSDSHESVSYQFDQEKRKVEKAPLSLRLRTYSGIVDPTDKPVLPVNMFDERPQLKMSLTEVDPRDVKAIHDSIAQLEIAELFNDGQTDPSRLMGLRAFAAKEKSYLENIWISKLSSAFTVSYFDVTNRRVDTMTLGNFNVLVYPDNRIAMEVWLYTENGGKLLLKVLSGEHGLGYEEVQRYLDRLHPALASNAVAKRKK